MVQRPLEKERIKMIIRNLLSIYRKKMYYLPISKFGDLFHVGLELKDKINMMVDEHNFSSGYMNHEENAYFNQVLQNIKPNV